jgi:hypothetical protein
MRSDAIQTLKTANYTKKTITIRPDKDNELFTFNQIKTYCNDVEKTLGKNEKMVVKGLNILKDSTLRGYNDDFMSEDEWDEYCQGKVHDSTKFNLFYNFTIVVRSPNKVKK